MEIQGPEVHREFQTLKYKQSTVPYKPPYTLSFVRKVSGVSCSVPCLANLSYLLKGEVLVGALPYDSTPNPNQFQVLYMKLAGKRPHSSEVDCYVESHAHYYGLNQKYSHQRVTCSQLNLLKGD